MAKRDLPARAARKASGLESRKGKGRARTRAGGLKIIDDPKTDERRLAHQLKSMGLYAAHTLGDGNCLFRALSDQLYGTPNHHATVRADVCNYLASNEARYKAFVDTDEEESWENHLREMRRNGTYGGHLELSAFAHLHRRPIKVIQPGLVYIIGHEDESPAALKRRAEKEKELARNVRSGKGKQREDAEPEEEHTGDTTEEEFGEDSPLYIIYHQWEHYSSVRNIDGPHVGHPRIRERKVTQPESPASSQETDSREDSVATDEIDLLRKSLPSSQSERFSDQQLSQLVSKHGSWEKTLEVLLEVDERSSQTRDRSDEDDDVVMLDGPPPPPSPRRIAPSPIRIRLRAGGSARYRDSSPATSSSTATDSNPQSSCSTEPPTLHVASAKTSSQQQPTLPHHHLRAQQQRHGSSDLVATTRHQLSIRDDGSSPPSKAGSRSRSPEASASPDEGVGRRLRRRPLSSGDLEAPTSAIEPQPSPPPAATSASPSPSPSPSSGCSDADNATGAGFQHVNNVSADLDAANERPTRLRHRDRTTPTITTGTARSPPTVPASSPPSRAKAPTAAATSRRDRKEARRARKRETLARRAAGATPTSNGGGAGVSGGSGAGQEAASVLFKELRV